MKRSIKFLGVSLVVAFAFAISACTLVEKDEEEKSSRREQTETRDTTKESTLKAPETTPTTIDINKGTPVTSAWDYDGEDDFVEEIDFETENGRIKYLSYEMTTSLDGEPVIRVFVEFENKTEDTIALLDTSFLFYACQNGERLETSFSLGENWIDSDGDNNEALAPGEKIIFSECFLLNDTTTTIKITASEFYNLKDGQFMFLPIS